VISSRQARAVCEAADRFGRGCVHLTSRGSIEIHWIKENDLPELKRLLSSVGLTSRGACGGAVRGVSCSSRGSAGFPQVEALARRLHRHFSGNPRFERLPKKFKIAVEADYAGRRHLIQDVGLVLAGSREGRACYDVWIAGGLGREPQAGFLLTRGLVEERVIPLVEAIVRVYASHTPPGKRLKHLVREIGREELVRRIEADPGADEELPVTSGLSENLVVLAGDDRRLIQAPVFAGNLSSAELGQLADFADSWSEGTLMVTTDQDVAFELAPGKDVETARGELAKAGFSGTSTLERTTFRICPGAHECRMGLALTRDVARTILDAAGPGAEKLVWAISGCVNSCTQPQLADAGIVVSKLVQADDGQRTPRFDVYRSVKDGLGQRTEEALTIGELLTVVERTV
jgi:ferredoxin-nitrite reductase